MTPNNDDILAMVLAERGEGADASELASVASDPRSAEAYRDLAAIAELARGARAEERVWRDRAVVSACGSVRTGARPEFRGRDRTLNRRAFAAAAAAAVLMAAGAVLAWLAQPDSATEPIAVARQSTEPTEAPFVVGLAAEGHAQPTEFGRFHSLADSFNTAAAGSTVRIQATDSGEQLRVSKPMKLLAVGGTVRIGVRQ